MSSLENIAAASTGAEPGLLQIPEGQVLETLNQKLVEGVNKQRNVLRRSNTLIAYDPKDAEYMAFCNAIFPSVDLAERYRVTANKVYNFMFYQVYRSKRKPGKGKKTMSESSAAGTSPTRTDRVNGFSLSEYMEVMLYHGTEEGAWKLPNNPLGFSQINTYKASILRLFRTQKIQKQNSEIWENVWTKNCSDLFDFAKKGNLLLTS